MANTYKNAKVDLTTTNATTVLTTPVGSTNIIKSMLVSEDSGNADTITLTITDTDSAVFSLFKVKAVSANTTVELLTQPLVLQDSEILKATAATANRLHLVVSYLEISQDKSMNLGNIFKKLAPLAINAIAPGIGQGLGSPAVMSLLSGALGGEKPQNMLKGFLLDKLGLPAGLSALGRSNKGTDPYTGQDMLSLLYRGQDGRLNKGTEPTQTQRTDATTENVQPGFTPKTYAGEFAQALGFEDSMIGKLLNTNLGEGLAAGLLAQLLASGDEEEKSPYGFEQRPFGAGGPGGQVGGLPIIGKAQGGEMQFPRRDGGIDPSEGSGTKDDVPAMLTAGEFVLTKDAVKGLGNGNQRLGIQRAYDMMGNLERMA